MAKVTDVKHSVGEIDKAAEDLVAGVIALHPDLPATHLIEPLYQLADEDLLAELGLVLRTQYFLRLIRTVRAKGTRDQQHMRWLFSGLKKVVTVLPERVPIAPGLKKPLAELNYKDLGRYLKLLNRSDRAKHANNAKILAVKELMKLWPARTKRTRGLTLKEVDAKKAGF